MKHLVVMLLLCMFVLAGCENKDLVVWSPDGERVAVIASDGIHVGNVSGTLSAAAVKDAKFCRWMPDSKHALVGISKATQRWADVSAVLSPDERKTVQHQAERIWITRAVPKEESSLQYLRNEEALLYLVSVHGLSQTKVHLHQLLGKANEILPVSVSTLQIMDLSATNPTKPNTVFRTTRTIKDARVSPKGTLAAVCIEDNPAYDLLILPLKGGQPEKQIDSLADCPDWSSDGKSIFYVKYAPPQTQTKAPLDDPHDTDNQSFVAWINRYEVADADGNMLAKLPSAKKLIQVFAEDASRVRCMPDGSVIFHARQRSYPSIVTEEPHACLFKLSPDLQTLQPIAGSTDLPGDSIEYFEPNKDGTKIVVPSDKGAVAVLGLASGKVTVVEEPGKHDLKFAPHWRTNDELCFPSRKSPSTGHDAEVVLQSISQPEQRTVLSKEWSAKSIGFLKDSERKPNSKSTSAKKAPAASTAKTSK